MLKLPPEGKTYGLMGYFKTPADLYHACEQIRDAGYRDFDAHTPFPVHGLEKAMGLPPSKIGWISLLGGAAGLSGAVALTYYVAMDYPLNISGKYAFSYQVFVPIYFELTVLLSALATFFGLWIMCKLPSLYHPIMKHSAWKRATDDAFFICIEAKDPKFDLSRTKKFMAEIGAKEIEEVTS